MTGERRRGLCATVLVLNDAATNHFTVILSRARELSFLSLLETNNPSWSNLPTRGRWVQLPLMSIVEDGFEPLVIVVSVVFHVPAVTQDVHLPGSDNTTLRTFIEDDH